MKYIQKHCEIYLVYIQMRKSKCKQYSEEWIIALLVSETYHIFKMFKYLVHLISTLFNFVCSDYCFCWVSQFLETVWHILHHCKIYLLSLYYYKQRRKGKCKQWSEKLIIPIIVSVFGTFHIFIFLPHVTIYRR